MYKTCKKGHLYNPEAVDFCPVCKYGISHEKDGVDNRKRGVGYIKTTYKTDFKIEKHEGITPFVAGKINMSILTEREKWLAENLPNFMKRRTAESMQLKIEFIKILREKYKMSFPQIGKLMGYSEHSTACLLYNKYLKCSGH